MTEPRGPEDGFDLDELAGYLEELQFGVDAHVTEARLLGLHAHALKAIDPTLDRSVLDRPVLDRPVLDDPIIHGSGADLADNAWATPAAPAHLAAANPHAQTPGRWPGEPSPLPVPPLPLPPIPLPPPPLPLPMPPLPTEPVPPPPSSTPTWREPEDSGRDSDPRGVSKRQR